MKDATRIILTVLLGTTGLGVARTDTFPIDAGALASLISTITSANGNGVDDTIQLAPGATYDFNAADNGKNALPIVTSKITITGASSTAHDADRSAEPGDADSEGHASAVADALKRPRHAGRSTHAANGTTRSSSAATRTASCPVVP